MKYDQSDVNNRVWKTGKETPSQNFDFFENWLATVETRSSASKNHVRSTNNNKLIMKNVVDI